MLASKKHPLFFVNMFIKKLSISCCLLSCYVVIILLPEQWSIGPSARFEVEKTWGVRT